MLKPDDTFDGESMGYVFPMTDGSTVGVICGWRRERAIFIVDRNDGLDQEEIIGSRAEVLAWLEARIGPSAARAVIEEAETGLAEASTPDGQTPS